jgi:hypothetical protein
MPAGNTYEAIATTTVGTATNSVTFSSIAATYTDLVLVIFARNTTATNTSYIRLNGDSGANYSSTQLYGDGSTAGSNRDTSRGQIDNIYAASSANASGTFSTTLVNIQNYANTTTYKTVLSRSNLPIQVAASVGLWRNTAAINSVQIVSGGNFEIGSTFNLFGIKAA